MTRQPMESLHGFESNDGYCAVVVMKRHLSAQAVAHEGLYQVKPYSMVLQLQYFLRMARPIVSKLE